MFERPPARACKGCTLCCKLINVLSVSKERGEWCRHCDPKTGCAIYAERPFECTTFQCLYLEQPSLGEHWFPKKSKMVVMDRDDDTGTSITVFVDAGSPGIWREPAYYRDIKHWARSFPPAQKQILVVVGDRVTLVLPDKDVDLGVVRPDQLVVTKITTTPRGPVYDGVVMERGDPRLAPAPRG